MNCLSKLNTKTFVAASLLAGAGVTFASVGIAKGYNLSPLETYIIESFAQEQIDGFINSGATTLFESPKIFYITPRALARQVKTDLSGAQKKYLGNYGIVKSFVSKTNKDKTRVQFDIPKPDYTLDLHLAKNADPDLAKEVGPGERHGFYCQITSVDKSSAVLSGCLPLRQFASLKRKQIEALIHRYLAGEKVLDPNLPTYAMMAYMAVVSARLLPRDSVCRRTVEDEIIFTDADRRLCNQEVADLWQRADSNPKFDKTMDNVVEELTKHGVDVSMINQAASSLD